MSSFYHPMKNTIRNSPSGRLKALPPPNSILWATDGSGDVETWDEVTAAVQDSDTPITAWLVEGAAYTVPPGSFDLRGLVFEAPRNINARATLTLTDGALIRNPGALNGAMYCYGQSSSPCIAFDSDFGFLRVSDIATIQNLGTAPMIELAAGKVIVLKLELLASLIGHVVNATGGILGVVVTELGLQIDDGFATGAGGAGLGFVHDGSLFFPTVAGFGSVVNIPMGQDGGYGPTSFRPQGLFQPVKTGCAYWDTTLLPAPGKMIWFNGTLWVDATGTPV